MKRNQSSTQVFSPAKPVKNHMLIVALLLLLSFVFPTAAADAKRPNVVLIISDDHAWTDYSFAGHPHAKTPISTDLPPKGSSELL